MTPLYQIDRRVYSAYQETLLKKAERFFGKKGPKPAIRSAFLDTPRHWFASRYYSHQRGAWMDLNKTPDRIDQCLSEIYQDNPLALHRDAHGHIVSTISQPTLVLYMLDLLDLKKGQKVFELGGGSGWNAAMMGRLVGEQGLVVSIEIVDALSEIALPALDRCQLPQVRWQIGDGSPGSAPDAPFQRGVFTASAWELPACFFDQIENEGLLLLVLRLQPGTDLLATLRKQADCFVSELHFPCNFVPVTGERLRAPPNPVRLVNEQSAGRAPHGAPVDLEWSSAKIQELDIPNFIDFLNTIWDCQHPYLIDRGRPEFLDEFQGYGASPAESIVLFNDDAILQVGTEAAAIELRRAAKRWLKANKPSAEDLDLRIHRSNTRIEPAQDQWLVKRGDCTLCWTIR